VVDTYSVPILWWQSPLPYAGDMYGSLTHGLADHVLSALDFRDAIDQHIFLANQSVKFWVQLHGVRENDDLDFYFFRPDGSTSAHWHWFAPEIRYGWWVGAIRLPASPQLGTWSCEFLHNNDPSSTILDSFSVVPEPATGVMILPVVLGLLLYGKIKRKRPEAVLGR
jgi:hypothetical protein